MRVLQVVSHFDLGGAERVAINIAKSRSEDFSYHIVEVARGYSRFSVQLKEEMKENGIVFHCSPIKSNKLAIVLFPFWFFIVYLKLRPQIVHVHTEVSDLAVWFFRRFSWILFWIHPRYVRTIHNTQLWSKWGWIGNMVERFYLKHHCNIAISTSTQELYVRRFGGSSPPIIYNGVEAVIQKPFEGLPKDKINILFAGRLEYQKGVDQLLAVILSFNDSPLYFFTIVGRGSLGQEVQKRLERCRNVQIYDQIFGLSHYLSSFDYLFMPSNFEGLALMSIEASFAKLPTIINRCLGLKETLPEDWPLAVEGNSISDFIELFRNRLSTYSQKELGNEAYTYVSQHFTLRQMQLAYEKVYRSAI